MNASLLMSLAALSISSSAFATDPCADSFARRGESPAIARTAGECYLAAVAQPRSLTRAARALSFSTLNSRDKEFKAQVIALGFQVVEKMSASTPDLAPYWRAVFLTFEANRKDEGSILPRHILSALPEIRSSLQDAEKRAPGTHFHGPLRVQGAMLLSMPGIVGGDNARGLEFAERAYTASPEFAQNQLWYAKGLIKNRRKEQARTVLTRLAELTRERMDPDYIPETVADQAEAKKILGQL